MRSGPRSGRRTEHLCAICWLTKDVSHLVFFILVFLQSLASKKHCMVCPTEVSSSTEGAIFGHLLSFSWLSVPQDWPQTLEGHCRCFFSVSNCSKGHAAMLVPQSCSRTVWLMYCCNSSPWLRDIYFSTWGGGEDMHVVNGSFPRASL